MSRVKIRCNQHLSGPETLHVQRFVTCWLHSTASITSKQPRRAHEICLTSIRTRRGSLGGCPSPLGAVCRAFRAAEIFSATSAIKIAPIQTARRRRPTSSPLRARSTFIGARAKHVPKPAYRDSQEHPPHGAPVPRDGVPRICERWR